MDTKLIWKILDPERNFLILISFVFSMVIFVLCIIQLLTIYVNWAFTRQQFRLMTSFLFVSAWLMIPLYIEYKKN